jgi:hypothetical protein
MMHIVGAWMQGRYFLPAWIGAALLAAWAMPESLIGRRVSNRLNVVGVACWILIQGISYWTAQNVFRNSALSTQVPGDPRHWRPETGTLLPWLAIFAGTVGTVVIARYYLRANEVPSAVLPPSAAPVPTEVASSIPSPNGNSGQRPRHGFDEDEPALTSR